MTEQSGRGPQAAAPSRPFSRPELDSSGTYEGRALMRPDDEVVDQGLAFDLGTLFTRQRNRRGLLALMGAGASAAALAACAKSPTASPSASSAAPTTSAAQTASQTSEASQSATESATETASSDPGTVTPSTATVEINDETAGPYPGDGSNGVDVLEQSGVVRRDIRSSFGTSTNTAEGVPLTIQLTIQDLQKSSAGWAGLAVYAWHCDRDGNYSMYSNGITNENYLRGVQITDAQGTVSFTSIFPACYSGRWPHIHFEVYPSEADITDASNVIATSQIALPEDVCKTVYATAGYEQSVKNLGQLSLATDNVFGDDSAANQMGAVTGDVTGGYTVALSAAVDASTKPAVQDAPPPGR